MRVTVATGGGDFSFECAPNERILYTALRHGVAMPYECATGTCGTCRGRVVEGQVHVEWDEAPGFAKLRRDKGDVLLCQARPGSDCLLRVPANVTASAAHARLPQHRTGRIENVRRLTGDVLAFDLPLSEPMDFEAGQFVVLETPAVRGGRAYSMVNFESGTDRLALVVKQKPGGVFSDWLFQGDVSDTGTISVFGPLGRATFRPEEQRNVLCIAGGSGIAGMMSIIAHALESGHFASHSGHVYFGVRTLADGFYMRELADCVDRSGGRLEVTLALSHEAPPAAAHPQHPDIRLAHGLVVDVAAREMAGRTDNIVAFVAGPPPMVDAALRHLIREVRVPSAFVRYDKFS